jgi:hypothetical protein
MRFATLVSTYCPTGVSAPTRGYTEHATETTREGSDKRTFRKDGELSFTDEAVPTLKNQYKIIWTKLWVNDLLCRSSGQLNHRARFGRTLARRAGKARACALG